ncbi:MAG: DUF1003 domain-containing protein [Spirochaetes bacterium]|nr:DUF1003 domain-containing protein [Spirochaetota bacterium]
MNEIKCEICKKIFPEDQLIIGHGIRHEIEDLIRKDHPGWNDTSRICKVDFNTYRIKYIINMIEEEKGSIEILEDAVIKSIKENDIITFNTKISKEPLKVSDRISDKVASFGGSWKFIIIFFTILLVWILINSLYLLLKPFDPYPYILLNLILSCLAAIQAPIIMMSQNRQEMKDRIRSENDYKINLKSEIEIRTLHEKVDHLLLEQWSKMMRIQEIQIEILEEIRNKIKN